MLINSVAVLLWFKIAIDKTYSQLMIAEAILDVVLASAYLVAS
jgi:hypothetical protein